MKNEINKDEKFRCPKRDENIVSDQAFPGPDHWRVEKNNDLCCSYCGSMHPAQLFEHFQNVISDSSNKVNIEYLRHKGKFYIERPEVHNAGDGAIKAYSCHIDMYLDSFDEEEQKNMIEVINKAIETSIKKHEDRFRMLKEGLS